MARILNHRTRSEEIITSLIILFLNDKSAWKSYNVKADSEIFDVLCSSGGFNPSTRM